ncbi:sugar MFS transporter [Bacteroides sp. 51]|uniref:sugar MFS transporter n=1 Tax=Bacteroides sp. 51 TaxID=2302938 RepID=UPI0013D4F105|nr:glucose/galactose MFS transporter [Bacteroides sp. 51]
MTQEKTNITKTGNLIPMFTLGMLFFIFGLVSWVNAILIPYFKVACELTHTQSYLVALAFYIAYLVMSIPASKLLSKVGYKRGIMIGLWFMAAGTLLFIPAAYTRTYGIFLTGLFTIGTGLSILQTAANPYVVIIGPIESAARRISIMGLCNKIAGIIAPLLFAAVILKSSDSALFEMIKNNAIEGAEKSAMLDELIRRVIVPYLILSGFLFLFGCLIRFIKLPDITSGDSDESSSHTDRKSILDYPYLIMGAIAIFFHVAAQIISIDTVISYAEMMGLDLNEAKIFPSITLSCALLGYFLGILLIPKVISQKNMLRIVTTVGLVFSICILFVSGHVHLLGMDTDASIWFLCLLGIPNALIYAGIWPLAIHDLGKWTSRGSSLMVMALCGNAFMPVIYGMLADSYGLRIGYVVLIPCFLYLMFYAFYGHKVNKWSELWKGTK